MEKRVKKNITICHASQETVSTSLRDLSTRYRFWLMPNDDVSE
jgi:hypothetical protein